MDRVRLLPPGLGEPDLGQHTARSGSAPGERVNPAAIEAMSEAGIDISGRTPQKLNRETAESSDVIITMGCGDACPIFPGKRTRTGSSMTRPAEASTRSA